MPIKIQSPEEVSSSGLARLGISGPNGAGKTTFLSTIPPSIKTLVVSAGSENVKPLVGKSHIKVAKINIWDDLYDVARLLRSEKNPFKCVAFDTWTRFQNLAFNKVARGNFNPEQIEAIKNNPRAKKGWDVWEDVGALAGDTMKIFLDLPIHVVFLFQEDTKQLSKVDGENDIKTTLDLTKAALRTARDALEIIGRLYVVTEGGQNSGELTLVGDETDPRHIDVNAVEKRMLFIGQHDRYLAKGPTHILGRVIEDPTWEKLSPAWTLQA